MAQKLKMGMVGGGKDAFIGGVHRAAARLDGEIEIVAGALSSTSGKAKASGRELGLPEDRNYGSWEEMLERERSRPEGERIDLVSIVTPNHVHFPVAKAFAEARFNVVCDKPLVLDSEQATKLVATVERAGVTGAVGDIGSHAENLMSVVTGLELSHICADLTTFVPGRELDDDGNLLLRFQGGAKGLLFCSQISTGEENDLRLRVYGTKGGLSWRQEEPTTLSFKPLKGPVQVMKPGHDYLCEAAQRATRLPAGHPDEHEADFPTVYDGARGVHFIEKTVASSDSDHKWTDVRWKVE